MSKITLRHLRSDEREKFEQANNADWDGFDFAHYFESLAENDYEKYISIVPGFSKGEHIPSEHVPCTFLFAFNEQDELVGRTSIRHELTDFLLKAGGHVGYGVVPAHRRKGYATEIMKESLNYIKKNLPELKKILVTCDEGNIGSEKTIEKNGGELENIIDMPSGPRKKRYWINLR
jgi:predicted acetyltransferase